MGPEAIDEAVLPLVGRRVGFGGSAQQGQADDVVADVVAVLAVVEQRRAVVPFAQIHPLLGAGLEARPVPRSVAVGRPPHVAPLDLIGRLRGQHVHREGDLEQRVALAPIHPGIEVKLRPVGAQRHALHDAAAQHAPLERQRRPQRPALDDANARRRLQRVGAILVGGVNVPGIPLRRPILERLPLVGHRAGRQHVAAVGLVEDAADVAGVVELGAEVFVFQEVVVYAQGRTPSPFGRGLGRGDATRHSQRQRAIRQQRSRVKKQPALHGLCDDRRAIGADERCAGRQLAGPEGIIVAGEAGGVDQHHVAAGRAGHDGQRRLARRLAQRGHLGVLPLRLFVDRADAAAGDDVVELVEADQLPRPAHLVARVDVAGVEQPGPRAQEFGVVEQKLAAAVGALIAPLGRVGAAVEFQIQLSVPDGQPVAAVRLQAAEEVNHSSLSQARQAGEVAQHGGVLVHLSRRPAAAVAIAVAHQHGALRRLVLQLGPRTEGGKGRQVGVVGGRGQQVGRLALAPGRFGRGAEVGQHARAVQPLPPEAVVGHRVGAVPADLDGEEVLQPRAADELRQVPGVAEHVGQPQHGRLGCPAELPAEESPAEQQLTRQRLRPADVAVGLHPHAADRLPAPLSHAGGDLVE